MKHLPKPLFLSLLLAAVGFGLSACTGYVDEGPRYGYYHRDGWYHDGPWMGGPRGYVGVGVHVYR